MAMALALWAQGADACRLALVLALDVSNSVDQREDALQRGGLAAALRVPAVRDAFLASNAPVALAVFEWSARDHQNLLHDWVVIDNPETLDQVAAQIATTSRSDSQFATAIGHALRYSAGLLARAPRCDAQTIDISGDGVNNDGFTPHAAYDAFNLEGVIVNGLVIDVPEDAILRENRLNLPTYYDLHVINGPGAFIEVANGFDDFARAMEMKLIRELGVLLLGENDTQDHGG